MLRRLVILAVIGVSAAPSAGQQSIDTPTVEQMVACLRGEKQCGKTSNVTKTRGVRIRNGADEPSELFPSSNPPTGKQTTPSTAGNCIVGALDLPGIQFRYDSDQIEAVSKQNLDRLTETLLHPATKNLNFFIVGHTDSAGAGDYNRVLSERRALAVVQHLAKSGVDIARLTAVGKGADQPKLTENPLDPVNRRVEVISSTSKSC